MGSNVLGEASRNFCLNPAIIAANHKNKAHPIKVGPRRITKSLGDSSMHEETHLRCGVGGVEIAPVQY